MQLNSSKTVIASGIAAIGIIFLTILYIWKTQVDADTARLHKIDDLRKSAVFIDQMRLIEALTHKFCPLSFSGGRGRYLLHLDCQVDGSLNDLKAYHVLHFPNRRQEGIEACLRQPRQGIQGIKGTMPFDGQ